MFDVVTYATIAMLGVALLMSVARVVQGPTLPDRVVAMDLLGVVVVGIIVVLGAWTGVPTMIDVAIVIALIGFLGTVAYATFVERGRPR
jgi:multicomponent Na+:H+ antiporter subunit F